MNLRPLEPQFSFAGFTWPRYVATLTRGRAALKRKKETRKVCGEYYHAPRPLDRGENGRGFYLDDAGQPFSRWRWCDELARSIGHTGWYCDEFGDTTLRGFVAYLPHGRYLAGWSMGERMASYVAAELYTDELSAALAADSMAEHAAEQEREFRAAELSDDAE